MADKKTLVLEPKKKNTWHITFTDGSSTVTTTEGFKLEPGVNMFHFYNNPEGSETKETIGLFSAPHVLSIQKSFV